MKLTSDPKKRAVIAYNLKRLRLQRKLTVRQVAKAVGLNVRTVNCYEQGVRMPDLVMSFTIAKLYKCKVDHFERAVR